MLNELLLAEEILITSGSASKRNYTSYTCTTVYGHMKGTATVKLHVRAEALKPCYIHAPEGTTSYLPKLLS